MEKELELRGYDVSAIKMEFEKQWYEHIGGSLTRIIVYLRNAGDLPTYAVKAKVTINQESKTVDIFRRPIPLGESSVEIHVYAVLLSPGTHPVKVALINDEGKEVASIKGAVTFPYWRQGAPKTPPTRQTTRTQESRARDSTTFLKFFSAV